MGNVLSDEKKQQVLALGRLGWPLRRIEESTGVRRETASRYLRAAGVPIRAPRNWGHAKPAKEVITDLAPAPVVAEPNAAKEVITDSASPVPRRSPSVSACELHRDRIELAVAQGRNAMAIYQDLVVEVGFTAQYASVMRFVRGLRATPTREAHPVIVTAPGEEAQVDYGEGPMVRHPITGKYRRTRLFVMTLGHSRKAVRLLTWKSSTRIWCELHEQAYHRRQAAAHAGNHGAPVATRSRCWKQRWNVERCDPSRRRRSRHPPHPGRARTREEARRAGSRRSLQHGSRRGRAELPLRAHVPRAPVAAGVDA